MSTVDLSTISPDILEPILNSAALMAPKGQTSNLINPPNMNSIPQSVIPIVIVFVSLALMLRAYSRIGILKQVQIHDGLIVVAYLCFLGYIACVYYVTNTYGFFVHQWNISVRNMMGVQHALQVASIFYVVSILFGKCAILLQWIQLFTPKSTNRKFFWVCTFFLWLNILFYGATGIAGNLICVPFARIWDKTVPGTCYNGKPLNFTIGVFNLFSDLIILAIPQKIIWGLHLPPKKRFGLALIFALGLIACGAAALRVGLTMSYMRDSDWLFRVAGLSMSCIAEMACIILVHCMPGIPSAFGESSFLSSILRSFRSSIRSFTALGSNRTRTRSTNTGGGSSKQDSKGYHEMGLTNVSQDPYDMTDYNQINTLNPQTMKSRRSMDVNNDSTEDLTYPRPTKSYV